jgi:predicted extracellular nuclease
MSRYLKSTLQVFIAFIFIVGAFGTTPARRVEAASTNVVISEVYGGGGNFGATYTNDFIELFNLGTAPVDLTGWSVQYASSGSTGTTVWAKTDLTGTIQPGGYFLVQEAAGTGGTTSLPTPDASGSIAMSGTNGKVALVSNQTSLIGTGSPTGTGVVDFVGYGSANVYEGSGATPALTNSTSAFRSIICMDIDDNKLEFAVGNPTPQNSAITASPCSADAVYMTANPANGSTRIAKDSNIILKFNKAVSPLVGWFSLTCNLSGSHTATPTIDGTTITLDPAPDFAYSEVCTLAITGSLVNANMAYSPTIRFSTAANLADVCGDPYTPISTIQGFGSASLYSGFEMVTEGVVTADLQSTKNGVYIQDPNPDANSLTSEGMFIYTSSLPITVPLGARLRVTGTVTEFSGLTEMTGPFPRMINCGDSGVTISPVALSLPFVDTSAANLEPLENMLVHFAQPLVINEYYNFDRYGEIVLSSKRLDTPTNVVTPGAAAIALQAANNLDMITLDDGVLAQNPEYLPHPNGGRYCQGTLVGAANCPVANIFRGGDLVSDLTAVLDYVAGGWKLIKTQPATYTAVNSRTAAPDLVAGELRISSINTLNYFITLDSNTTAGNICGPLGNMECRGAESIAEFTRQRPKTIATVIGMASDITGLLELENDNPTTTGTLGENYAIADIVAGLNVAAGAGTYEYIATGSIGTDAIKAGIVYKPAKVTPVGNFALLTSAFDPDFIDTCNRPVLAQTFRDNATQQLFTVAINHLKSKSSACAALNDVDTGDGQGAANLTRTKAAEVEVAWLETDPTGTGSQMYLIMGDLNSYAKEDPINAIKNGKDGIAGTADDYFDLVERFREIFRYPPSYGYVYGAQAGYLDGALANRRMASYVLDAKEWHINADEADVLDYNTNFRGVEQQALYQADAYRSSDHDPILVSLMLNHDPAPVNDAYSTYLNQTLTVSAANGVLANDSDDNIYDKIIAVNITQPSNGTLLLNLDGSFTYIPNQGFSGVDTFEYTMVATPGLMGTYANSATVTITVKLPFDLYLPIIAK